MEKIVGVLIYDAHRGFTVWAARDKIEIIRNVPGVHKVFEDGVKYDVYVDPRYDKEQVLTELKYCLRVGE